MTEREIEICRNKDKIDSVTLRHCPTCGHTPKVNFERSGTNLYGVDIFCCNLDCPTGFHAHGGNMEKASERWNTRADGDLERDEFVKTDKGWILAENAKYKGGEEKGLFE